MPMVAENFTSSRQAAPRHLWLCPAAPLLIAAGMAATGAPTDLRTNPCPSFAPDATAGYAISYERVLHPARRLRPMQANWSNLKQLRLTSPRWESCIDALS